MRGERALVLRPDIQSATSSSYDADGFLEIGVDGDAANTNLPPAEALHPLGFFARPLDPGTDGTGNVNQGQACNVLRLQGANTDDVIALSDPRVTPNVPQVPLGSAVMYESGGAPGQDLARVVAKGDDHSITVHVPAGAKVTIEVTGGPSLTIDTSSVQLGAAGGSPVVIDNGSLAGAFQALQAALAGLGASWTPPTGYSATKAKAT